ncbi:hypothetical protein AUEXF2481DRAFT_200763 [Aureobasidium subglaciale EXF-2481]|uniref:Ecp2 effector protein domain-containing protein n=1 Tax=Aureobasidium subglaciale (strain EXF-2481) TaxID=1043005 RepID=A0A074YPZ8_AURSE|nr:uncharacterized protein AUEXF2481DRAFT_200763 [Aureobasidium subglaciale EXF-2481]KAI5211406.1 hypothetical protein E4T38_01444 [Aureobasidium subglaciale]KAI5229813.1 hypothetical protein E4T40_01445 [Aureobasidium subglaciale]KAI5233495.1 hypothetical protein E4T41_01442 [Aureobasidium subglaciale]KAI5266684.1 hypothetical protein E4T46_01444 [Aureobasidium subglaciale]KEQ99873.1 hypothetical protein AUEXF2481DRAFT_200763 [Aureobasidium subglaciale EXF-2481]
MKLTTIAIPIALASQAAAAPTHYQPPLLNSTVSFQSNSSNFEPLPPSSCFAKVEDALKDLTSSTLSILLGSSTTMLGYALCGITMPAESWETCTDYAVIGGSVVGLSHLAIWKFPELLNDFDLYDSTVRPWEEAPTFWGEDEGPNGKVEVMPRIELDHANLGAWP